MCTHSYVQRHTHYRPQYVLLNNAYTVDNYGSVDFVNAIKWNSAIENQVTLQTVGLCTPPPPFTAVKYVISTT